MHTTHALSHFQAATSAHVWSVFDKVIQNSLIPVYDYLKGEERGELIGISMWEGEEKKKNQRVELYFHSFSNSFVLLICFCPFFSPSKSRLNWDLETI